MNTYPQDAVQDVVAQVVAEMIDIVASDSPLLLIPPLPGRQLGVHQPNIEVETDAEVKLFTDLANALGRRTR
jgi:hypothetical protein